MAGYVTSAARKREPQAFPKDLPDATGEHKKNVPEGAVFVSDDKREDGTARKFRLKYPQQIPAQWVEVLPRERKPSAEDTED